MNDTTVPISKDATLCLVNISANEKGADKLLNVNLNEFCPPLQQPPENIIKQCLYQIFNKQSKIADQCCMILSNLTRPMHFIECIIDMIENSGQSFDELINIFTKKEYNKYAKLHYLGPMLSNLTQSRRVRKYILDKEKCVIQRLLPYTEYKESLIRRGGIIGNILF